MTKAEEIARKVHYEWMEISSDAESEALLAAALEKFGAEERERCAKIADAEVRQKTFTQSWRDCAERIAARIREGRER